jgi:uncharacterized protein
MHLDPADWWSNTYTGKMFKVFAPVVDDIDLGDIEHALAKQCRFGNMCDGHYSVAEHSVNVMKLVMAMGGTIDDARWALMHDATEAYMGDMIKPLKDHPSMAFFKETEKNLATAIAVRFGMQPLVEPAIVKKADYMMLRIESDLLIPRKPAPWNVPEVPDNLRALITIHCHERDAAKLLFRSHFQTLFPAYV